MNKEYLDYNEFVPYAPDNIGEEVNVHHCKQGKNNDRLYIKRTDDGSIIAYCHHCGLRGISKSGGVRNISYFRKDKDEPKPGRRKELKLPSDLELDINKWPIKAKAWPMKYGITEEEINANHMGYSEYFGRVVLPCFDEEGQLSQFQTRRIDGLSGKAAFQRDTKYDTYIKQGSTASQRLYIPKSSGTRDATHTTGNTLCIVEDALSAIKCNRIIDTIALNGSSLDDSSILSLSKRYDNFIIFLDNDNRQVKKSQTRLKRKLELICRGNVKIAYSDKDPKELSMNALRSMLV